MLHFNRHTGFFFSEKWRMSDIVHDLMLVQILTFFSNDHASCSVLIPLTTKSHRNQSEFITKVA